jgi:hypothetical protein
MQGYRASPATDIPGRVVQILRHQTGENHPASGDALALGGSTDAWGGAQDNDGLNSMLADLAKMEENMYNPNFDMSDMADYDPQEQEKKKAKRAPALP